MKMKDSGIEWIGEIPEHWEIVKISNIFSVRNTKVSDEDYPALSVTKMGILPQLENVAKSDAHDNRKLVLKGDFAINSRSDRRGSCGMSDYDGSVSLIITVLKPENSIVTNYYHHLFRNPQFSEEFYRNGRGIVDDLWTTGWQNMKGIQIPYPPIEEQEAISSYLNKVCGTIDSLKSDIENQIDILQEYKKSVITEVVTKGLNKDVEMKESGIDWIEEVPKHWLVGKIKNMYNVVLGKMVESTKTNNKSTYENYMCAANIKWNGINKDVQKQMYFTDLEKNKYLLKYGDLLIMEGGDVGTSCIYRDEFKPCYMQNSVNRCRGINGNLNMYLYYWLFLLYHIGYIDNMCNKATIKHYTKEKVENTIILNPPIKEQEEIVSYLDKKCSEIDSIIETKKQQIETLEEYKKSTIYEYVTGKRGVSRHE